MSYPAIAPAPSHALGLLMPMPGPLGRLVRRRRSELGLTQKDVNDRTRQHGYEFGQNNISRLESGVTQRVNDVVRLTALGKALEFENDREFILTAFGPKNLLSRDDQSFIEADGSIVRIVREMTQLDDQETEQLRRFIEHARETPADAAGPSVEERIAAYARHLMERRGSGMPAQDGSLL